MGKIVDCTIEIVGKKGAFILGEPVEIEVSYLNNGQNGIEVRDPSKTWEVMMEVVRERGGDLQRFPFGKILSGVDELGISFEMAEPADTISIAPKTKYTFVPDVYTKYGNFFCPGEYHLKVIDRTDDNHTSVSNEFRITISAAASSYAYLVSICTDPEQTLDNRGFATYWLKQLYPDFMYTIVTPDHEQSRVNTKSIADCEIWWKQNSNKDIAQKRIAVINKQAGIIDEND